MPYCLSNLVSSQKAAFTLAEVLITLGIIGIVAAMTIPTLVQNYKERVTVTKVKKTYAVLTNALQLAILENGTVDTWGLSGIYKDEEDNDQISQEGSAKFAQIFSKYLRKSKICEGNIDCTGGYEHLLLNGDEYTVRAEGSSSIILPDGTGIWFTPWTDNCHGTNACGSMTINLDLDKKRHYGVNTFTLYVYKDRFVPWGSSSILSDTNNAFSKKCIYNGGNFENGLACTGWVLEVGNMDYLHCDGLSWDGKHSCD